MTFAELSKKIATCYNSLPALADALRDGFANIEGGGSSNVEYSTTEHKIGKWIDGKPLYEKTISFGSFPNNTQKNVAHGISDVDLIVKCEGIGYDSSYKSIPVPYSNVDSVGYQLQLEVNRTNVSIKSQMNATIYTGYITLQYTKTTDTANS